MVPDSFRSFKQTFVLFIPVMSKIGSHKSEFGTFFSITYPVILEPPSSNGFFQDKLTESRVIPSTFGWSTTAGFALILIKLN